jgi:hypothetical protein
MRRSPLLLAALASIPGALFAQSSSTANGAVSGHVYCSDTHTPCRLANVAIQTAPPAKTAQTPSPAQQSHAYSTSTGMDGSFHISGVAPGDYYILSHCAGYLSPYDLVASEFQDDSALTPQALDIALTRITVEPGHTTTSDQTLSRGATLGGTVKYDDGGFAIAVAIHLFRKDGSGKWQPYANSAGDSTLEVLGFSSHTDDRGRFYAPGLAPGMYLVEATLPEFVGLPVSITDTTSMAITSTSGDALQVFNGDKYRLRDAPPIELREGEDRSDIDIILPTNGLHSIHGSVTAKSDGHNITHGDVRLLDPDDKTMLRETQIQGDGSFLFNYVVNGSYLVEISPQADKSALYQPLSSPLLVESDIPSLTYALVPAKP